MDSSSRAQTQRVESKLPVASNDDEGMAYMSATDRASMTAVSYRILLVAGAAAMIMFGVVATTAYAQTTTDDETSVTTFSISGTATANGEGVPPGTSILVFTLDEEGREVDCGRFTTESGGRFTLSINVECRGATQVSYRIEGMSAQTTTVDEIKEGLSNLTVGFSGLSDEELLKLGLAVSNGDIQQVPLISQASLQWILILTVVVGATVLLTLIVVSGKSDDPAGRFQMPTEALILLTVIIAVIILGVTGKIGSDGLISVLAAIVGWTAARAGRSNEPPPPPVINIGGERLPVVAEEGASEAKVDGDQIESGKEGGPQERVGAETEPEGRSPGDVPDEADGEDR